MALLWQSLGVMVITLLASDVLLTVFHPQGHGGPLNRAQSRLLWRAMKLVGGRRGGTLRPRFLAICGPIIAVLSVATWGLWLIAGFALLYYPSIDGFTRTPAAGSLDWVEAVYYSGYVASTLGLGDSVASTPALRLLTVVEAMSGFALFAIATTYLLAVYQELARETTLAMEIANICRCTGPRGDQLCSGQVTSDWILGAAATLLRVTHSHGQYPVLHYFRPKDEERALVVQLAFLIELTAEPAADPALPLLRGAVGRYLSDLNHGCLPGSADHSSSGSDHEKMVAGHRRLLEFMCYPAGFRKRQDPPDVLE